MSPYFLLFGLPTTDTMYPEPQHFPIEVSEQVDLEQSWCLFDGHSIDLHDSLYVDLGNHDLTYAFFDQEGQLLAHSQVHLVVDQSPPEFKVKVGQEEIDQILYVEDLVDLSVDVEDETDCQVEIMVDGQMTSQVLATNHYVIVTVTDQVGHQSTQSFKVERVQLPKLDLIPDSFITTMPTIESNEHYDVKIEPTGQIDEFQVYFKHRQFHYLDRVWGNFIFTDQPLEAQLIEEVINPFTIRYHLVTPNRHILHTEITPSLVQLEKESLNEPVIWYQVVDAFGRKLEKKAYFRYDRRLPKIDCWLDGQYVEKEAWFKNKPDIKIESSMVLHYQLPDFSQVAPGQSVSIWVEGRDDFGQLVSKEYIFKRLYQVVLAQGNQTQIIHADQGKIHTKKIILQPKVKPYRIKVRQNQVSIRWRKGRPIIRVDGKIHRHLSKRRLLKLKLSNGHHQIQLDFPHKRYQKTINIHQSAQLRCPF